MNSGDVLLAVDGNGIRKQVFCRRVPCWWRSWHGGEIYWMATTSTLREACRSFTSSTTCWRKNRLSAAGHTYNILIILTSWMPVYCYRFLYYFIIVHVNIEFGEHLCLHENLFVPRMSLLSNHFFRDKYRIMHISKSNIRSAPGTSIVP
jgi:hypothetical protein